MTDEAEEYGLDWDELLWQILVAACVIVAVCAFTLLIWRAITMSQHVDVEHERTNQVRIHACEHTDNVQLCIVKTEN